MLIKTITSMVLVSIHPFALRKIFLVVVAFLCFSAFCFADPVLMVRRYGPHSTRFGTVDTPERYPRDASEWRDDSFVKRGHDNLRSLDFPREHTKSEPAEQQTVTGVSRLAPTWILQNAMRSMRSTGRQAGIACWKNLLESGEI